MENEYADILTCFDSVTCLGVWYVTWDVWKDKSKNTTQLVQVFSVINNENEYNCVLTFDGKEFRRHWGTLDVEKAWRTNSIDMAFNGGKDCYLSHKVTTPSQLIQDLLSDRALDMSNIMPELLLRLYMKISYTYYITDLQFPVFDYPTRTAEAGREAITHARKIDSYR